MGLGLVLIFRGILKSFRLYRFNMFNYIVNIPVFRLRKSIYISVGIFAKLKNKD